MEVPQYFDLYSSKKSTNPAEKAEACENPGEPGALETADSPESPENPAAAECPEPAAPPETPENPVDPGDSGNTVSTGYNMLPENFTQTALTADQLGYGAGKPRKPWIASFAVGVAKAVGYFLIYFGIEIAVSLIFGSIWYAQITDRMGNTPEAEQLFNDLVNARSMMLMIVVDLLFAAAMALIFTVQRKSASGRGQNRALVNPVAPGRLAMIFGIGFILNFAITIPLNILAQLLPPDALNDYAQTQSVYSDGGLFVYIIAGVILAPIIEELLFRGLISTRLTRGMPAWIAVLISAVGFGIMHGNLFQGIYAGSLGILLGAVFFRERSLFASVALHFGFNLASLPLYILEGHEEILNSAAFESLYSGICMLAIPAVTVMLICYFLILKKSPARPGAPEVNAWLTRE